MHQVVIIGAPIACKEGIRETWREVSDWAAGQLKGRFGDQVQGRGLGAAWDSAPPMIDRSAAPLKFWCVSGCWENPQPPAPSPQSSNFMFGMIGGTIIANWRNVKITEATYKEFGEHVVNDGWNVFVTEFNSSFIEHFIEER